MSDSSSVSVIIPCYRQAHFLRQAIDSALSQHPEPEVIVVDDGSPDDAAEIASQYSQVLLIRQSNRGVAAARNAGALASSGEYLIFLDADDLLLPGAIDGSLSCFRDHPSCGFVYGQSGSFTATQQYGPRPAHIPRDDPYADLLSTRYIGMHGAAMFTREAFRASGGYQGIFSPCEDYALELTVARMFPVARHSQLVASHRVHGESASADIATMLTKAMEVLDSQEKFVRLSVSRRAALALGKRKVRRHYVSQLGRSILKRIRTRRLSTQLARDVVTFLGHLPRLVPSVFSFV